MALQTVTFQWSDEYGPCFECGLPAAYVVHDVYGPDADERACCRCAALSAAEGHRITYLFEDE